MKLSPLHFHLSMPTWKFKEKKESCNIVFSHTKVVFSSPKSAKKDQNMTVLGYSCGFYFKKRWFYWKFFVKKILTYNINEVIIAANSMNVKYIA